MMSFFASTFSSSNAIITKQLLMEVRDTVFLVLREGKV